MNEIDSSLTFRQGKTGPGNRAKHHKIQDASRVAKLYVEGGEIHRGLTLDGTVRSLTQQPKNENSPNIYQ